MFHSLYRKELPPQMLWRNTVSLSGVTGKLQPILSKFCRNTELSFDLSVKCLTSGNANISLHCQVLLSLCPLFSDLWLTDDTLSCHPVCHSVKTALGYSKHLHDSLLDNELATNTHGGN